MTRLLLSTNLVHIYYINVFDWHATLNITNILVKYNIRIKMDKIKWFFPNGGWCHFGWFSDDHTTAINVEEFKLLIQVCLNKLKFKFKYCCISKLLSSPFLTYYFCFQTITTKRFVKTNFNSVYTSKLIFITNIKVEFVYEVDPHWTVLKFRQI